MSPKLKLIQPATIESVKRRFGIIGNDPALNHAIDMALRVAPTAMNVLITGENGSGKESFSKIIHAYSSQKHGKFIAVNCGALPEGTIDSELFGHEKGSFTGAHEGRKGHFQEANHGTIFLDEIGEMPLGTQARLLRVLEYGEFMKVGSSKVEQTEVRVIAATHVDLRDAVQQGRFREDLYYRLNTVSLHVPPLRQRSHDILRLFKKFTADFSEEYGGEPLALTDDAARLLMGYAFPGNIRELKNLVVRMSILETDDRTLTSERLMTYLPEPSRRLPTSLKNLPQAEAKLSERELLYKVLFDMQRDLVELKKLVFEGFGKDAAGYHLLRKHGWLFEPMKTNNRLEAPPVMALPSQEDTTVPPTVTTSPEPSNPTPAQADAPIIPLEEMEKQAIARALAQHNHSRKKAAQDLGIPERTLYRKLKKYDLAT